MAANMYHYLGPDGQARKLSIVTLKIVGPQYQVLKREDRLDDGTLTRDVIARKRKWTVSYEYLPGYDSNTVDNAVGYHTLHDMFTTGGALEFRVPDEKQGHDEVSVMFEGFEAERVQVRPHYAYRVMFGLVEI